MKKLVRCGDVEIGGCAPVSIQSMTNVNTEDAKAAIEQIARLSDAGCQIVRLACPTIAAAEAFATIKKAVKLPLVADIHFDYRLAIAAIENGADKIRINPGNIGSIENIKKVVEKAKERNIPIRVGVNAGSLEKDLISQYGKPTAKALVESAKRNVKILEDADFEDIVISIKSSNIKLNYDAHVLANKELSYPLHIGLTESGTSNGGRIKSAIGVGSLLLSGIGNTMRISLTGDPVNEVILAREILENVDLRKPAVNLISCPTCGRTKIDLEKLALKVEESIPSITQARIKKGLPPITIAVMGCEVNGPGEAKGADFGMAAGNGKVAIFSKGKVLKVVSEKDAFEEFFSILT